MSEEAKIPEVKTDKPGPMVELKHRPRRWNGLWTAIMIITLLAGSLAIYMLSPGHRDRQILKNTVIEYRQPRQGYTATYRIESLHGQVLATLTMDDLGTDKKITSGSMAPEAFVSLFSLLEDMGGTETSGDFLTIIQGKKRRQVFLGEKQKITVDVRMRILEEEVLNRVVNNGAPGAEILAEMVDSSKNIGITREMESVFFNTTDGQLNILRMGSRSRFPLGNINFVESNFEGLGLVVEDQGNLYFWERKNLQNRMFPLAEPWVDPGPRRRVIVRGDSVYFMAPEGKGDYSVNRYDYVNREIHPVVGSTPGYIIDVTDDDEYILIGEHQEYRIASIFYSHSGHQMGTKFPFMPDPPWRAFGFHQDSLRVLAHNEGFLNLFYLDGNDGMKLIRIAQNLPGVIPEAVSPDGRRLLFSSRGIYFIYEFETEEIRPLSRKPLKMINPRFCYDGSSIIFTRFDGLYRFSIDQHEEH